MWRRKVTEDYADGSQPLAGRRVLITRAPHQALELDERLQALGAETILIPTIEIVPPTSFAALDEALARIATFDWLVLTSANGMRAFAGRAMELKLSARPKRIAVVGPATARTAESIGLRVHTMPRVHTAEALAERLLPEARGQRFLLVLAEGAPRTLEATLTAGGAQVFTAAAYANRIPQASLHAIKKLFAKGARAPDAVTFTSASTASHLAALLEAAEVKLPESVARISIGPITSAALRRLGIPPHAEAAEATIDALAAATVSRLCDD
ncbi:MAG TPA: uroporphyrinogen-III synthase [Acidobacteriaceae bacterium]|nr:uroporphyrinogen-III synthase [Acidobacteriaceae bacterium]